MAVGTKRSGLPFLRKYEFCSMSDNNDLCVGGDSGGPLVCEGLLKVLFL